MQIDRSLFRYHTPIRVRFAETDANGHMSHVSPIIYMEQVRSDFVNELGLFSPEQMMQTGMTFVLAKQSIEYRQQAYYNDLLDVYCRVSRIGTSSLDMEYLIVHRERDAILCTANSTLVYFDAREQRSTPLPTDLSTHIERLEAKFQ